MPWVGSVDDLQDITEQLDNLGVVYLLIVGRPGEKVTHHWFEPLGNLDVVDRTDIHSVVDAAFDEAIKDAEKKGKE